MIIPSTESTNCCPSKQINREKYLYNLHVVRRRDTLNQSAYCAAKKIGYSTFHYWYGLYRKKKIETGLFLPVKVMSSISNEHITIIGVSGIKLEVSLTEKSIGFVKQLLLD